MRTKNCGNFCCASAVLLEFGLTLRNDVFGIKCVFRKKFKGAKFWPFYKVEVTTNIAEKIMQVLDYPSNFQKYWPFQNLDNLFSCSKSLVIRSRAKRHTCKNRKIRLMGWTMTFCTFWGPWYAIVELFWRLFVEDKFKRSKDPSFWKMFFCNLPAITKLLLYEINIYNFS